MRQVPVWRLEYLLRPAQRSGDKLRAPKATVNLIAAALTRRGHDGALHAWTERVCGRARVEHFVRPCPAA